MGQSVRTKTRTRTFPRDCCSGEVRAPERSTASCALTAKAAARDANRNVNAYRFDRAKRKIRVLRLIFGSPAASYTRDLRLSIAPPGVVQREACIGAAKEPY